MVSEEHLINIDSSNCSLRRKFRQSCIGRNALGIAPLELPEIMVGVAQLVEHPVVVRDVAGSTPVAHPMIT